MVPRLKLCTIDFIRRAFDCFGIGALCGENEAYIADYDGCTSAIHRATTGMCEGFVKLNIPSQHNTIPLNTRQHNTHDTTHQYALHLNPTQQTRNTTTHNTPTHSKTYQCIQYTNKIHTPTHHNMTTHTAQTPLYTHIHNHSHLQINVQ